MPPPTLLALRPVNDDPKRPTFLLDRATLKPPGPYVLIRIEHGDRTRTIVLAANTCSTSLHHTMQWLINTDPDTTYAVTTKVRYERGR